MKRYLCTMSGIGVMVVAAFAPGATAKALSGRSGKAVKAFDTTATVKDPAWFERMYGRGFRLYVLHSTEWGTCRPWPNTTAQLKMALDAGLKIAAYTRDPRCWREGIEAVGPYVDQLQFFALDIENDPGVKVTHAMVDGVRSMGVLPVIYSGSGMWPGIMGSDDTHFANVPLWDTQTGKRLTLKRWRPSLFSPAPLAYGGWNGHSSMRVGVQQAFEVSIDGVSVDLNSFAADFLK